MKSKTKGRSLSQLLLLYAALIYVFLYAPIIVLMVFSFSTNATQVLPIESWTIDWYRKVISNPTLRETLINSTVLSTLAAAFSTPLGLSAAYAVVRYNFKGRSLLFGSALIPLIIPYLVTGISVVNLYGLLELRLSLWTGVVGEVLVTIPFAFLICMAGLLGLDRTLEEAAMDLGANSLTTFFRITLPIIKSSAISSALFAFVMSFNEFYVAHYTLGQINTLPIWTWSMWFYGVTQDINAASVAILFTLLAIGILLTKKIKIEEIVG